MILFLKSNAKTVDENHHHHHHHEEHEEDYHDDGAWTSLTVWRKSLVFSCNGFTVIDSNGGLVFRVDNYSTGRPDELILMDADGTPLLSLCRRKKLRLVDNWLVFEGEVGGYSQKKPICCVRKHINILQSNFNVIAQVHCGPSNKKCAYVIEGSYAHRSCRVLDESRRVVAEIKRKEAMNGGVSFGLEVFLLIVRPGFNPSFAMAIVLLLDQMFS
ncbi:hypothetical protein CsSME_00045074 [Camellia sinensis var. sinensis]|uniref:Protein LURP-one-related 8 n=1 Tax=Camellia sinensis var. sinensis TaxID=542762 RepID=A0A4S4CWX1_CAMSN|nr:protein LURP-one-related 17-like [Camellia sinensis]THF94382.1 hypothetical protein TEA_029365 [Camellia sinensis var. sinensis]